MRDADAVLTLAQWFSPSFPVGAFSYSHGMETEIAEGRMVDAATVEAWIADVLRYGAGRNDVILLHSAYTADAAALQEYDTLAQALAPSQERLLEALQQGAAFARTIRDVWGHDVPDVVMPLAVGAAAARQGLPLALTAETYAHSFVANLVSAAVRLVPLGQTEGQKVLLSLKPVITEVVSRGLTLNIHDLGAASFAADIAAMRHETLYARIFRS
ncbi:MAG: urease accessory UreF family protein [Pseudomonadota bacterium]